MHKLSKTDNTVSFQFNLTEEMAKEMKEQAKILGHVSTGEYLRKLIADDIADCIVIEKP